MSAELRHIAVHVEEATPGRFEWVLSERPSGRDWVDIDRSTAAVSTYKVAMAAGLVALQAMVEDLDIGPRRSTGARATPRPAVTSPHPPPASALAERRSQPAAKKLARKPSLFGFGPAV